MALEAGSFDRRRSARAEFVVTGAAAHNSGVVVSNVGHVGRLIDNCEVAFGRNHSPLGALRSEFSCWYETILFRTDVVVIISPILNSGAAIEMRFGRERRPTDVVTTLAPRNPRRCPFVTWDPDPADVAQAGPSTVVISRPA